jgi:hypothetical protein
VRQLTRLIGKNRGTTGATLGGESHRPAPLSSRLDHTVRSEKGQPLIRMDISDPRIPQHIAGSRPHAVTLSGTDRTINGEIDHFARDVCAHASVPMKCPSTDRREMKHRPRRCRSPSRHHAAPYKRRRSWENSFSFYSDDWRAAVCSRRQEPGRWNARSTVTRQVRILRQLPAHAASASADQAALNYQP